MLAALAAISNAYTVTDVGKFMPKNSEPMVFPSQYDKSQVHIFSSGAVNIITTTSEELQQGCNTAENPMTSPCIVSIQHCLLITRVIHPGVPTLMCRNTSNYYNQVTFFRFSAYYRFIAKAGIAIP